MNITLKLLSRENVIIPGFPKFSRVSVKPRFAIFYVLLVFASYGLTVGSSEFDFWSIFLGNVLSIVTFVFIFNGLCTLFFFVELRTQSIFPKILITISLLLFPIIFEVIGITDCVLKLREMYVTIKNRR